MCLFSWILFCSVLRVFWRLFILFCCYCYFFVVVIFFKNNWCFFSLNLSYLKTVYKICIFFRDVAFFIVIVAIPVFFRLIKILIKLKGLVQTNSVSETPTVIPCNRDPVPQYSKLSVSNTSINLEIWSKLLNNASIYKQV